MVGLLGMYELMKIMKRVGVLKYYRCEMALFRRVYFSLRPLRAIFINVDDLGLSDLSI